MVHVDFRFDIFGIIVVDACVSTPVSYIHISTVALRRKVRLLT